MKSFSSEQLKFVVRRSSTLQRSPSDLRKMVVSPEARWWLKGSRNVKNKVICHIDEGEVLVKNWKVTPILKSDFINIIDERYSNKS